MIGDEDCGPDGCEPNPEFKLVRRLKSLRAQAGEALLWLLENEVQAFRYLATGGYAEFSDADERARCELIIECKRLNE